MVGFLIVLAMTAYVAMLLMPRRHVTFYADDSKMRTLLEIKQINKLEFPFANYTILDAGGVAIGKLKKNVLFDFIRRRWYVTSPSGLKLFTAKEDSIILSLLRRTVPILSFLRTNFIFSPKRTSHRRIQSEVHDLRSVRPGHERRHAADD